MAAALVPLQNITLSGSQASVTFASIPTTGYRDLRLVIGGATSTSAGLGIRLNGDSGSNYHDVAMFGNGSTTGSNSRSGSTNIGYIGISETTIGVTTVDFFDTNQTDKHKSYVSRSSVSSSRVESRAGRWSNTSAVTSLYVTTDTGTFSSGTTISLFGVVA